VRFTSFLHIYPFLACLLSLSVKSPRLPRLILVFTFMIH